MMARDRRQRFVELAEKRTEKALRQIRLIGNLADTSNYEYTESDVEKIMAVLRRAIDDCETRYALGGKDVDEVFKL